MPVDGGMLFGVFLSSFPEGPCSFPYILFITVKVVALVAVYDSTFVVLGVLVLGLHEYLFYCSVTLEVNLYAILTTYLFYTFSCSFCIWYNNLSYFGFVATVGAVMIVVWPAVVCCTVDVVLWLCSYGWVVVLSWISWMIVACVLPVVI